MSLNFSVLYNQKVLLAWALYFVPVLKIHFHIDGKELKILGLDFEETGWTVYTKPLSADEDINPIQEIG